MQISGSTQQRVLIIPIRVSLEALGKKAFFLFSVTQVEDILREASIYPVPFALPHLEGISKWRDHIVPVICLEKCLGFKMDDSAQGWRMIMIRAAISGIRGMVRVAPSIRMLPLPIRCAPIPSDDKIKKTNLIRGLYEWDEGYLVVVHMENILRG